MGTGMGTEFETLQKPLPLARSTGVQDKYLASKNGNKDYASENGCSLLRGRTHARFIDSCLDLLDCIFATKHLINHD